MGKPFRIIFMGTPEFAVPSLDILVKNKYTIAAVITAPDKPAGRGQKIQFSPVKEYAISHGLPVLQPTNLKDEKFLSDLRSLQATLQIVVAFRMLPESVWKMPELGTFNLHASLLPDYRGAAPINWAIINGEKETGVTTFFLRHEIDAGAILFQEKTAIGENETVSELHDRLRDSGATLVLKTVRAIETHAVMPVEQDKIKSGKEYKTAPKLTKENTRLDVKKSVAEARNFIRGLSPHPAAYAEFFNPGGGVSFNVKFYSAQAVNGVHSIVPGTVESDQRTFLHIYCADGYLDILELQLAGRSRMVVKDFLNGFRFDGEWLVR